jgi:hypothetical protein
MHHPPPYRVVLRAKGGGPAAGGAKKRILLADVLDAKGKLVGTTEVPVTLEKFAEKTEVAEAHDWVLPPKLLVSHYERRGECSIGASLAGAAVGHHRATVTVNDRSYVLFARCERLGGVATFNGTVPLPYGPAKVTIAVPGIPSESFAIDREPYRPKPGKMEQAKERVAKARASLAAAPADRRTGFALSFAWACGGLATQYRGIDQPAAAIQLLQEGIRVLPAPGAKEATTETERWRQSALWSIIDDAWRAGDAATLAAAARERTDATRAYMARTADAEGKAANAWLNDAIANADHALPKLLSLGATAQAKALWAEKQKYAAQRNGPEPLPEPHPEWGPE